MLKQPCRQELFLALAKPLAMILDARLQRRLKPRDLLGGHENSRSHELLSHHYETSLSALNLCVARCPDRNWNQPVAGASSDTLAGVSGFRRRKCSRAELHIYNIRHIQHHAAQLSLRLRLDADVDISWVSNAWKEA